MSKNPLVDHLHTYLKQVTPHRGWHSALLIVASAAVLLTVWRAFNLQAYTIIEPVTLLTLLIYWFFQWRVMASAVALARYDWQQAAPDSVIGMASDRGVMLAKMAAILRHYRYFIAALVLILVGLSLALMVYLFYITSNFSASFWDARGIWKYVGIISSGYARPYGLFGKLPVYFLMASFLLAALTYMNTRLSMSIGLWAGRLARATLIRLLVIAAALAIFASLYLLRETPALTCHRSSMIPTACADMLFTMRLMDSIQAFAFTFVDGGVAIVTGVFCPEANGVFDGYIGHQHRHLGIVLVTLVVQFALSYFFLRRAGAAQPKKKSMI